MRAIKVYCPPGVEPPLYAFIDALDGKLKAKLLWQIFRLRNLPACELKEPHFKHFSLERYSQMYELREKGKVLIRIVFTVQNEDVILLTSFIKRQPRDTSPSAFRYAVRYEGHTDLAPYEFFECCNEKSDDEILGAAVQHYDVVEIDDGIKPAFFYKTEHGYELLFSFDAKIAKKNIREEID